MVCFQSELVQKQLADIDALYKVNQNNGWRMQTKVFDWLTGLNLKFESKQEAAGVHIA